jgi:hypothetical protein
MKKLLTVVILISLVFPSGILLASSEKNDKLTVGKVQREIRIGMPSANVIEVLGSPNIVSTDENRLEVWVYDKIATDISYSDTAGGVWLILAGIGKRGVQGSSSQRTLTIVVKFDVDHKVRDLAYHYSSF